MAIKIQFVQYKTIMPMESPHKIANQTCVCVQAWWAGLDDVQGCFLSALHIGCYCCLRACP